MNFTIFEFYKLYRVAKDFKEQAYLKQNPESKGFYEKASNDFTLRQRLYFHYVSYGDGAKARLYPRIGGPKKFLYLKPIHGLCNRINLINSAVSFCKENGHVLKVAWLPSQGFDNTEFLELFEKVDSSFFQLISKKEYNQAASKNFSLENKVYQDPETFEYVFSDEKVALLNKMRAFSFCYTGWASLSWLFPDLEETQVFYESLKPSKEIKPRVRALEKGLQGSVGIHIRTGDALKSNYGFRYGGTLNSFIRAMGSYPQGQKFFLATDSGLVEQAIKTEFPGRVITQKKKFVSATVTEADEKPFQKAAVVDLFALAKTKEIIGTGFSTFGKAAAAIGKKSFTCSSSFKPKPNSLPGLSLVVSVKNRFDMLKVSVHSWLQQPEIKEIKIINWSSNDFNHEYLYGLDSRIKVVDVAFQDKYHIPRALNTAMRSATLPFILKVDVDHIFNPYIKLYEWLDINWDLEFLAGYWRQRYLDNQLGFIESLNGIFAISRKNFELTGGYNEKMQGYGWEDCDMYQRLMHEHGLIRRYIAISKDRVPVYHNPHDNDSRMVNHLEKDREKSIKFNMEKSRYKTS